VLLVSLVYQFPENEIQTLFILWKTFFYRVNSNSEENVWSLSVFKFIREFDKISVTAFHCLQMGTDEI
jgi:hypothetical protein